MTSNDTATINRLTRIVNQQACGQSNHNARVRSRRATLVWDPLDGTPGVRVGRRGLGGPPRTSAEVL